MAKLFEVYRCPICGNMVEVVGEGGGRLVCCGSPMEKLAANTVDASHEKHMPVFSREGNVVTVKIGSVPHPMIPEHYIEWIEVHSDNRVQRKYLKPGDAPEALFSCPPDACDSGKTPFVYAYCNLHGLWGGPVE